MKKSMLIFLMTVLLLMVLSSMAFAAELKQNDALQMESISETSVAESFRNFAVSMDMDCSVKLTLLPEGAYLLLPTFADLSALEIDLAAGEELIFTGDLHSEAISAGEKLDITGIASQNTDGSYDIILQTLTGEELNVKVMRSAQIHAMFLTSANAKEEGREWVDASKSNETLGTMKMLSPDGEVIYDGVLTEIKSRGNSTFKYYDKKAYQIKLDKKTDLLGTGEKVKTWVLLAGYIDASLMRDYTFKQLAAELNMPYTVSCDWTDLYYDGEYRGTYLISEKNSVGAEAIDIIDMEEAYEEAGNADYGDNEDAQKDVNKYGNEFHYIPALTEPADISGGWLIELNHSAYDEICGFLTDEGVAFNVKGPEYAGKDAMLYISEFYQEFEHAVYAEQNGVYTGKNPETGKYYYEYCDKDSLVKMYLIQEFSGNIDAFASSLYFYKDAGGKLYVGPLWDLDASAGIGWNERIASSRDFLDKRYLASALIQIPDFRNAVAEYFKENLAPQIEELFGVEGKIAGYEAKLKASAEMNYLLWPFVKIGDPSHAEHLWGEDMTYEAAVDEYILWLEERFVELKKDYDPFNVYYKPSDHPYFPKAGESVMTSEEFDIETGIHKSVYVYDSGKQTEITVNADGSFALSVFEADSINTDYVYAGGVTAKVAEKADEKTKYSVWLPDYIEQAAVRFPYSAASIYTVAAQPDGTILPITAVDADGIVVYVNSSCDIQFFENKKIFDDVGDKWYKESIAFVSAREIMNGTSENTFAPDELLNRAMMAQILYNFDKNNANDLSSDFKDIPFGIWFEEAVNWAAAVDLVNGFGDKTFRPYDNITREQMVTILYRYFNFKGYKASANSDLSQFTDADKVSDWALDAFEWAVGSSLITGISDSMLAPEKEASRAEVATIMMRFCKLILNQ